MRTLSTRAGGSAYRVEDIRDGTTVALFFGGEADRLSELFSTKRTARLDSGHVPASTAPRDGDERLTS
jgi:hypothetical protein